VNVLTHPDIHPHMQCNASSAIGSDSSCDNIYDNGLITQSYGNDWITNFEGPGAWIEVGSKNEGL